MYNLENGQVIAYGVLKFRLIFFVIVRNHIGKQFWLITDLYLREVNIYKHYLCTVEGL